MVKDNLLLGKFDLTGIPPAPRGVPQIEVSFEVDANGILSVSAVDKGTGKQEQITITADKGRLSAEEIERMKVEAEQYAKEDQEAKERIDAANSLESYLYNLRNTLEGDDSDTGILSLSVQDKEDLEDMISETFGWMQENEDASKDDLVEKQKEIEQVANPIMRRMYEGQAAEEEDFGDEEL